jgi:hypothetical protein
LYATTPNIKTTRSRSKEPNEMTTSRSPVRKTDYSNTFKKSC